MNFSKGAAMALIATLFSGAAIADTAKDFLTATKVSQIKDMGAQQMDGASIEKIVSGKTLKSSNWTWTFEKDGKQSSTANDGSWTDKGTWSVKGNELCRESDTSGKGERCSKVYFMGRDLRFTDGKRNLHDWWVSY
ncbi:hypothetical protein [Ruegeria arenilitoris]|uniref:hypothetical protein n=1 Tax=Ruegeria arenilitoris TaxID=1173585 RepID=UPI00147E8C5E|nr:hypothetical protein [Ruegeria arenilitoris]